MRCLFWAVVLLLAAAGCGESEAPGPPELVRKCGELDGVEPVEPVVVGQYPIGLGRDETGSCPMFAPVPCTEPVNEYASLCGTECVPQTAQSSDGDTWLVGCAWAMRGMPCGGLDFELVACGRDPYSNAGYWFEFRECEPAFLPFWYCWPTCNDRDTLNEPQEWCPVEPALETRSRNPHPFPHPL